MLLNFVRIMLELQLTRTLGPIITTITYMFYDIAIFIVLWLIILVGFTIGAINIFNEIEVLSTFQTGSIYFMNAAFANYDLTIFDVLIEPPTLVRPNLRMFGIYYVLLYVFCNVLVLLNVLIALLSDTYNLMTPMRRGLYNYNIIKGATLYKPDKYYGGLIFMTTVMAPLAFCLLPYYMLVKDKARLLWFNQRFLLATYGCLAVVFAAVFIAVNLLLMPFAYLKTCAHKINLARKEMISVKECLSYLALGLFLMLVSQVTDLWAFLKTLFDTSKVPDNRRVQILDPKTFRKLHKFLKGLDCCEINAKELIFKVRDFMKVKTHMQTILFRF